DPRLQDVPLVHPAPARRARADLVVLLVCRQVLGRTAATAQTLLPLATGLVVAGFVGALDIASEVPWAFVSAHLPIAISFGWDVGGGGALVSGGIVGDGSRVGLRVGVVEAEPAAEPAVLTLGLRQLVLAAPQHLADRRELVALLRHEIGEAIQGPLELLRTARGGFPIALQAIEDALPVRREVRHGPV